MVSRHCGSSWFWLAPDSTHSFFQGDFESKLPRANFAAQPSLDCCATMLMIDLSIHIIQPKAQRFTRCLHLMFAFLSKSLVFTRCL